MPPQRKKAKLNTDEAAEVAETHENEEEVEEDAAEEEEENELGSKVLRLRLTREGAHFCQALQASLIWNDVADLDLSCITPDGTTIYYGNKEAECGGWLDVDMNVDSSSASIEPVENIFWASAPSGKYVFRVTNYNCHTRENTVFTDSNRSVPYRVFLTRNGKKSVFNGSVKHKEVQVCFEFELDGDGALGSFVVMPPSDTKTTFKEACAKNDVTYTRGSGYYAMCRKENISKDKAMLLQDIQKDTFIIGGNAVRSKLGWPIGVKQIRKGPKDLPEGFRLFVQSTSHNRLIPPGTHTLMKVSIKEALKHRPAHTTQFNDETHTMGQQQA